MRTNDPRSPDNRDSERSQLREELALYAVLVVVGLVPVAGALVEGAAFGAEATLGLLLLVAGVLGLTADGWRARHRHDHRHA